MFILLIALFIVVLIIFLRHSRKYNIKPIVFIKKGPSAKEIAARKSSLDFIGNLENICPYCNQRFEKIPTRKKKCSHCGEYIYVRTRPKDERKVFVTKEQADKIDEQWTIVSGTHDQYLMREKQFANEKSNLTKIRGFEPSDNDVQWNLLNKEIIRHVTQQDWGFFRNTKFAMAEILRKESKLMAALGFYLEVCYIDLNGPNNLGGVSDSRLIREFPAWNPKLNAFLAPGVITRISKIIRKTESSEATVQKIFFQDAEKLKDSFHMPVPVGIAWVETKKALIENKAFY